MVEEIRYALTEMKIISDKNKALDISSGITSNTSCNYCGGEQMKVGYGLTLCLLIQFLIPTDRFFFSYHG